jgi:hypothetical protein
VDGWVLHGLWLVMFNSAKDRVLGVDTLEQHVSPCVRYGIACLIIRDAVENVPCLDKWEFGVVTHPGSHGVRRAVVPRLPWETLAMLWYCVLPYLSLAYDP